MRSGKLVSEEERRQSDQFFKMMDALKPEEKRQLPVEKDGDLIGMAVVSKKEIQFYQRNPNVGLSPTQEKYLDETFDQMLLFYQSWHMFQRLKPSIEEWARQHGKTCEC
jgi:hypothetical protein